MIPPNIKSAIDSYVDHGHSTGGFVYAVLCNDLVEAVARADTESFAFLLHICKYVFNFVPAPCWGSKKKVTNWLNLHEQQPDLAEKIACGDRKAREDYE